MKRVKVAVLDSGIADEMCDERIIGRKQFYYDYCTSNIIENNITTDYNGHGTAFVDTMWKVYPEIEVYVIKFLGISGRAIDRVFVEALNHASRLNVDIIVTPSSYVSDNVSDEVHEICKEINAKGIIIIAAVKNGENTSHIADYEEVIGVLGDSIQEEVFEFNRKRKIQMVCSFNPIVAKTSNGIRKLFQGNSKATAIATGIIAKYLGKNVYQSVTLELEKNSYVLNSGLNQTSYDSQKENYYCEHDEKYQRLILILCEYFGETDTSNIRHNDLITYRDGYLLRGLHLLLQLLEERYNKRLNQFLIEDFRWAYIFYERYLKNNE